MKKRQRVAILSLGCSKNLVDSERLARRFADSGADVYFTEELPVDGSVLIVNTCGFIGDAKEESINTLLGAIELKNEGKITEVQYQAALAVSEQLLALMPADKEILQIREKILKMC